MKKSTKFLRKITNTLELLPRKAVEHTIVVNLCMYTSMHAYKMYVHMVVGDLVDTPVTPCAGWIYKLTKSISESLTVCCIDLRYSSFNALGRSLPSLEFVSTKLSSWKVM